MSTLIKRLVIIIICISCIVLFFRLLARGDPVDTVQFGLLWLGMTETQVILKLNIPDYRLDCGTRAYTYEGSTRTERVPRHHNNPSFQVRCEQWVYRGMDTGAMDTYLTFENGRLTEKVKRR